MSPVYPLKLVKAYLIDYETQEKIELQYNPIGWKDDRAVEYASHTLPGLSHPIMTFVSGGERVFKADIKINAVTNPNAPYLIHWIRARTYPERFENMIKEVPHRVLFIYPNSMWILGVITAANRTVEDTFADGRFKYVTLELQIKETIERTINMSNVYTPQPITTFTTQQI